MRELSDAEARYISSLLNTDPPSERDRARLLGMPRRTCEDVSRRVHEAGWVLERYIPNPARYGLPFVSFVLLQPYSEMLPRALKEFREMVETVVLWSWNETIFAVLIGKHTALKLPECVSEGSVRRLYSLRIDLRERAVQSFFDFGGAWSRYIDGPTQSGSPRGLRNVPASTPLSSRAECELVLEILKRTAAEPRGTPLRRSPYFLPRSQRKLVQSGSVDFRSLLNLTRLPTYQGKSLEHVVFVCGDMAAGRSPEQLEQRLRRIRVCPFIFASDGQRALMVALSPAPKLHPPESRPSVLGNLEDFLTEIEILREPIVSLHSDCFLRFERAMTGESV